MSRRAKGEGSVHRYKNKWRAAVTINGHRITRVANTKEEALQKRDDLLKLTANRNPNTLHQRFTTTEWIEHWLTAIATPTPNTERGYRSVIRNYINPHLGGIPLEKLQPEHIERLYRAMRDGTYRQPVKLRNGRTSHPKPLAAATIRLTHTVLHRALHVAEQRGHLTRNPAALIEPPKPPKPKVDTLQPADVAAIMAAAKSDPYGPRWALGLLLGLRPAEALGLTWAALDGDRLTIDKQLVYDNGTLALQPSAKTASGHRVVVLPEPLVDWLGEWRAEQYRWMLEPAWRDWTFAGDPHPTLMMFTMPDGSPLKPRYDATLWKRLLESAGVPHTRLYTARHTSASLMVRDGSDIAVVAATLGHRDSSFTYRTYVHPFEEEKTEQAKRMGRYL